MNGPSAPREMSRKTLVRGKFLQLQSIRWRDRAGRRRTWESVSRVRAVKAVIIVAWLDPSERLLLIRQFRAPARGYVIEFPAGLIDKGETPRQAARRELLEETGYRGHILGVFPAAFNSPGMSDERAYLVFFRIDDRTAASARAAANPQEGEDIQPLLIPGAQLRRFVKRQSAGHTQFDSKVLAYIAALGLPRPRTAARPRRRS